MRKLTLSSTDIKIAGVCIAEFCKQILRLFVLFVFAPF